MAQDEKNGASRRDFLYIWTGAIGAVTAGSIAAPLIKQMSPDASTLAAGAPINIDLSQISEGQVVTIKWRGKPIFVRHRSQEEIASSQAVDLSTLKDPKTDLERVHAFKDVPQLPWIVVYGICTHLGCVPNNAPNDIYHGWYCPCHGSHYDNAGRVRKGPAPRNLDIPPYSFISETLLQLG